jgi:ApbE superfamily uncharacterized protein (UPF0280 family)
MNTDFDAMNRSDEDYRDSKIKNIKKIIYVGRKRLLIVEEVHKIIECLEQGEEYKSAYDGLIELQKREKIERYNRRDPDYPNYTPKSFVWGK